MQFSTLFTVVLVVLKVSDVSDAFGVGIIISLLKSSVGAADYFDNYRGITVQ
jgi:hypothetical protein